MTFGEKVKKARKEKKMSQDELAKTVSVSRRTITSWETDTALPRTRAVYETLAKVLGVPLNYLLSDDEAFIVDTAAQYGYRGRKDAEQLVADAATLFAGGDMAEEDADALMFALQNAYLDAKRKNKKYTPKKYRQNDDSSSEAK
jgi:transcriptional regulator with XRE-family HTH domain